MKGGGRSVAQRAWSKSAECAAAAERGREQAAVQREAAPKCGAKRKTDGAPCEGLALENGRCRIHGGLTPKGDAWHRVTYPSASAPPEKLDKKLREIERRRRLQAIRVAKMPPAERAAYERRRQAMRPKTQTAREEARRSREAAALLRLEKPAGESVELARLRAEYEKLEADLAQINAEIAADTAALQTKGNTQ